MAMSQKLKPPRQGPKKLRAKGVASHTPRPLSSHFLDPVYFHCVCKQPVRQLSLQKTVCLHWAILCCKQREAMRTSAVVLLLSLAGCLAVGLAQVGLFALLQLAAGI
jgi:hypothetical protein